MPLKERQEGLTCQKLIAYDDDDDAYDDEIEVVEIQTPVDEETKDPYTIEAEEVEIDMSDNVL